MYMVHVNVLTSPTAERKFERLRVPIGIQAMEIMWNETNQTKSLEGAFPLQQDLTHPEQPTDLIKKESLEIQKPSLPR
jgi:hypothetical protein